MQPASPAADKHDPENAGRRTLALTVGALGIVYGDIGTSPLYALRACFFGTYPIGATHANVLGVLSLIFWSLVLVISVKYLLFVMRADNRGEGGILALLALLDPLRGNRGMRGAALVVLGIFGAALLYGDGMITPAISVLSAVEGLEVAAPHLGGYVLPVTIGILVALFAFQHRGTGGIGSVFGPVMVLWFVTLAIMGVLGIVQTPQVLAAVNPAHALSFFARNGLVGYLVLGAVFLVVTGGEALYADMGHFGCAPIRFGWFGLVLPSLLLNYFGQGATILAHPNEAVHPFYNLVPQWGIYPMIALATVVTVIASQAVISGAFSLTRQAILMGYSPRLNVIQTSSEEIGQIYIPSVNWALMIATVSLVLGFESSTRLTAAYGMAVSTTMVITTSLAFLVMWKRWRWHPLPAAAISGVFLVVDLAFFGANLFKIAEGGWLPLAVAVGVLFLMSTWNRGRQLLMERVQDRSAPLDLLVADISRHGITRIPGTAVFLTRPNPGAPGALLHHLKINQVLHENVIILTTLTEEVPRVSTADRLEIQDLGGGFYRAFAHYGFMQAPNVPVIMRLCRDFGLIPNVDPDTTAYYLGHATLIPSTAKGGMALWRKRLFTFMARNAQPPAPFFQLPPGRAVELGAQVEV
jgi:KUP system potassium uptake protein